MTLSFILDHFSEVRKWAQRHRAEAKLDITNFKMEVRCANRYFHFHPIFPAMINGKLGHVSSLMPSVVGFGGWVPYQPYLTRLSVDKMLFKEYAERRGLKVPCAWRLGAVPDANYIFKRSRSSFGYGIEGPYAPTIQPQQPAGTEQCVGELFMEQFVAGRIVKLWLWGATPVFADVQDYPCVVGDGTSPASELVARRMINETSALTDDATWKTCLAFQSVEENEVLETGRSAWIDFRYGRTFPDRTRAVRIENALPQLEKECGDQLRTVAQVIAQALFSEVTAAPLMCSVDGMLDREGTLWWLELNSNPLVPHQSYDVMLSDLFGRTG